MEKLMSIVGFTFMSLMFKVRDVFRPRVNVLKEAGIEAGCCVLDYGCGPGSYIVPLAEFVGPSGTMYALDIHPLAIQAARKIAARHSIKNLETIESACHTGLPENHVNVILLYDTFHDLAHPDDVLQELHRVLKPGGTLSFSDHHMQEHEILTKVTNTGMFTLSNKGKNTYSFSKVVLVS